MFNPTLSINPLPAHAFIQLLYFYSFYSFIHPKIPYVSLEYKTKMKASISICNIKLNLIIVYAKVFPQLLQGPMYIDCAECPHINLMYRAI